MSFFGLSTMFMKTSKLHVVLHDIDENKWLREDARGRVSGVTGEGSRAIGPSGH